jgi:hypothetical protein
VTAVHDIADEVISEKNGLCVWGIAASTVFTLSSRLTTGECFAA